MAEKEVRIKVPEIMAERGLEWEDLAYNANLSQPTARTWSNPEKAKEIKGVNFDTLVSIAEYLKASISDLLEIVDKDD